MTKSFELSADFNSNRNVIAQALYKLKLDFIAQSVLSETNCHVLQRYVKMIEREANQRNDWSLIEPLYTCGLV